MRWQNYKLILNNLTAEDVKSLIFRTYYADILSFDFYYLENINYWIDICQCDNRLLFYPNVVKTGDKTHLFFHYKIKMCVPEKFYF